MINDLNKFKQQCAEYDSFMDDIEKITEDYSIITGERNPFKHSSRNIRYEISKDNIYIKWEEEHYACGSYTEYYNITIPLNFYDNIDSLKEEKIKKHKEKEILEKQASELRINISKKEHELREIVKDRKNIQDLNKKHNLNAIIPQDIIEKESFLSSELKKLRGDLYDIQENINNLNKNLKMEN